MHCTAYIRAFHSILHISLLVTLWTIDFVSYYIFFAIFFDVSVASQGLVLCIISHYPHLCSTFALSKMALRCVRFIINLILSYPGT